MKKKSDNEEKPDDSWQQAGVISLNDIIDIVIEISDYDPEIVREAMMEFQKVLFEKLKDGYEVKSAFGSFYPHFDELNPITGEKKLSVEFVPNEETLIKIENKKLQQLNNISLN